MRGKVIAGARWAASTVAALATIFLVGWSGGLAGRVASPGDNSQAGWLAASAISAGLALFPAVACVAAARPTRFTFRLFVLSVVTWLASAVASAAGGFITILFLPLIAVMCAATIGCLAQSIHASTGNPQPPTS